MGNIPWDLVGLLVGFTAAINGITLYAFKVMLANSTKPLVDNQNRMTAEIQKLERDFLNHQIDVSQKYIAKEDWIRQINLIDAKMDTSAERQKNLGDMVQRMAADVETLKKRSGDA